MKQKLGIFWYALAAWLLICLIAFPVWAGEPCKPKQLKGAWQTTWHFTNGENICTMRCNIRIDGHKNVLENLTDNKRTCLMSMNGHPFEFVDIIGGRVRAKSNRYCEYEFTLETSVIAVDASVIVGHDWVKKSNKRKSRAENMGNMFQGTMTGDDVSGIVMGTRRSANANPF